MSLSASIVTVITWQTLVDVLRTPRILRKAQKVIPKISLLSKQKLLLQNLIVIFLLQLGLNNEAENSPQNFVNNLNSNIYINTLEMVVEKLQVITDLLKKFHFIIEKHESLKFITHTGNNLLISEGLSIPAHVYPMILCRIICKNFFYYNCNYFMFYYFYLFLSPCSLFVLFYIL